jgi:PAS domain S-box-containing protein
VDAVMAFVAVAPASVAVTDREMRFLKASPEWLEDFGLTEDQLLGRSSYELAPETKPKYAHLHEQCLGGAKVSSEPERVTLPNGRSRWMMWEAAPWRDDDGEVGGLVITSRDVTGRKEVEEELRRTRAFLTTVLENVPAPLIVKDEEGRILVMNRAMEELYGCTREEQLGHRLQDVVDPDGVQRILEEDRQVLASGEPLVVEASPMHTRHNGVRQVRKIKVAIRDGDGPAYFLSISEDITDRLKTQQELESTRAFLTTVLEHAPLPVVVNDEDGRVLLMNRAMENLYGEPREEHIGKSIHELLPPEVAERVMAENRQVFASPIPIVVEERRLIPARSEVRVLHKTKVSIPGGDGRRIMLAIIEDITERKKTEEELENTRSFLTNLIENVPLSLLVKDARDGRTVMLNRACETLLGLERRDILGKTAFELFPINEAQRLMDEDQAVLKSGQLRIYEDATITTPGGPRRLRQMKTPIKAPDGSPHVLTISEEISDRIKSAEELERTRAFLQTVLDNVPAALTVKDAVTGRVLMSNPAAGLMYAYRTSAESLGKTNEEVFPPDLAAYFSMQDQEVIASGGFRFFEEEPIMTGDGLRYLNRRKVVIQNPDGSDYLLSVSEDVTQRKQAQDDLKQALARAEAANVAKSEFLANMSHEIRTPLNGVLGLADALARKQLTPDQREIVEMILSSGKALTGILSDVLDLAKAEAGQLELKSESFDLRETIGQAAFLFRTVAQGKGLDFKVGFDADAPARLVGDPLRIKQVVSNLISNAVKFTTEGEVAVHAGARPGADGMAELTVTVSDTGPGFSEEVRAKLFGRFEQGDGSITRRFGGTGLGLSIANALAQMMGGEICCSAEVGEGATFVFRARLEVGAQTAEAPDEEAQAEDASHPAADGPLKVLLAEDHEVNQKVVRLMLGEAAELMVVGDGVEAVQAVLGGERFDVVLMDTQMPVMDGLTAIRCIRAWEAEHGRERTPIVSLTANAMSHQVEACLEAGADAHLAKPITSAGLFAAIQKVLEGAGEDAAAGSAVA